MRIDILTLFPGIVRGPLAESILGRAQARGLVDIRVHNLRDWAPGRHHVTDEPPFGGGGGMILKPEPLAAAIEDLRGAEGRGSSCSTPPAGDSLRRSRASWPGDRIWSWSAGATRASTSACESGSSTRSCPSATTC